MPINRLAWYIAKIANKNKTGKKMVVVMISEKNLIIRSIIFNIIFIVFMVGALSIIILKEGSSILLIPSFFMLMGFVLLYRDIKKLKKSTSQNT